VYVPDSSKAGGAMEAHTTYVVRNPNPGSSVQSLSDLAFPAPEANPSPQVNMPEYPASLACLYKIGAAPYPGCVPTNNAAFNAAGGGMRAIGIVDAFNAPTVIADATFFSSYFGLPVPKIARIFANGNGSCVVPVRNAGWELETALDVQWAHAMAPNAAIIMVHACSNSYADLMYAELIAAQKVAAYGGGIVSNSWGGGEWPTEATDYDDHFRVYWQRTLYIASSGDGGGTVPPATGVLWPSASPWVIAAGGTTINRDAATGNFLSESCWAGAGGGISQYELWSETFATGNGVETNYQYPLFGRTNRATPDIAADADPASGAWVYYNGAWQVVGGTSLAAPLLAGILSTSNNRLGQAPTNGGFYSPMEHHLLYSQLSTYLDYSRNFYDVTTGSNGNAAGAGWDYCTGIGSPRGKLGK